MSSPEDFTWSATDDEPEVWDERSTEVAASKAHPLDDVEARERHRRLHGAYIYELDRQYEQRLLMAQDEAIYDGDHWTPEELEILRERGQAPIVFNVVHTAVNWLLGSQRRTPKDFRVLPRHESGTKPAEFKSQILKSLADINSETLHTSDAFAEMVKAGLGWLECGVDEDGDGAPIYSGYESWRNVVWDSMSPKRDLGDARYLFRPKWVDLDVAKSIFTGERAHRLLEADAELVYNRSTAGLDEAGDEFMDSQEEAWRDDGLRGVSGGVTSRPRVRLIEAWYRQYGTHAFLASGEFKGAPYDLEQRGAGVLKRMVEEGRATIAQSRKPRMRVAVLTAGGMLYDDWSPYRHNKFPLTPMWGIRRASDRMPYGVIRQNVDIQRDINKRASKALHLLNAQRLTLEEGSVDDIEETRAESTRPDGVLVYKKGSAAPVIDREQNLAAAHVDMMARNIQMIQQTTGITDENLGRETNASSGKAIIARQDQGAMATAVFFDGLRYARREHGEKMLALVEQFIETPTEFRVTDQRGRPAWISVNDPQNHDTQITLTKADYTVEEEDWHATDRQAQLARLTDVITMIATGAPQVALGLLDLLIEAMDVPKRDEFVKRIRQMTGTTDPDADPNNPDPETQAIQEAKKAEAAMAQRAADAEISEKEAKAKKTVAEALRLEREGALAVGKGTREQIDILRAALDLAVQMVGAPQVAPVADELVLAASTRAAQAELDTLERDAAQAMAAAMPKGLPAPAEPQPAPEMMA